MKFRLPVLLNGAVRAFGILLEEYFAHEEQNAEEQNKITLIQKLLYQRGLLTLYEDKNEWHIGGAYDGKMNPEKAFTGYLESDLESTSEVRMRFIHEEQRRSSEWLQNSLFGKILEELVLGDNQKVRGEIFTDLVKKMVDFTCRSAKDGDAKKRNMIDEFNASYKNIPHDWVNIDLEMDYHQHQLVESSVFQLVKCPNLNLRNGEERSIVVNKGVNTTSLDTLYEKQAENGDDRVSIGSMINILSGEVFLGGKRVEESQYYGDVIKKLEPRFRNLFS